MNYAQSIIKLTHILLSSLHLWSLDQTLDNLFSEKLKLQKPKYPVAFGRISRGSHIFVMFPPKRLSNFNFPVVNSNILSTQKSINLMSFGESEDNLKKFTTSNSTHSLMSQGVESESLETPSPTNKSWLSAKVMTTEHLLTILSVSNSFMNLRTFIDLQVKREELDPIEFVLGQKTANDPVENQKISNTEMHGMIKQTYSRLSTMYCMLPEYHNTEINDSMIKSLNLETLALKWMDQSFEVKIKSRNSFRIKFKIRLLLVVK